MFSYNLTSVSIARLSIIGDVYDVSAAPEFFGSTGFTQDTIADALEKRSKHGAGLAVGSRVMWLQAGPQAVYRQ